MLEKNFNYHNMERLLYSKDICIEDLRMNEERNSYNSRHFKEKYKEMEGERDILKSDNLNYKAAVQALEEKNKQLLDKIDILLKKKVISKID
jgi:hypothetical protein